MADTSTCTGAPAAQVTPGIVDKCPSCGGAGATSRRIRMLGWLPLACGLFLIGLMGYITLAMYPTLTKPGVESGDGWRWTGTAEQGRMILNLF